MSAPSVYAFDFSSPGAVTIGAGAPAIIMKNGTVHVLAWIYVNSAGMPDDQKVYAVADSLILGVANVGGVPVLYPEVWDAEGNHFTFAAGQIPTNQWALVEMLWIQGESLTGFVNGVQVQSVPVSNNPLLAPDASGTSSIGAGWNGNFQFSGMVQSVLMTNAADQTATQGFAIQTSGAISNWGSDGVTLHGGASITNALASPPCTPYGTQLQPPAPTYVGEQLPASAPANAPFTMVVPSSDSSTYTILTLTQAWQQLAEITGQPGVDTGYEVDVTTGISISDSETQTLGVSLGLQAGFNIGIFSAQVNLTLSYSESFTEELSITEQTTIAKKFEIDKPSVTTTGVWWQLVPTLTTFQVVNGANTVSASVSDPLPDIFATAYPAQSTGTLKTVGGSVAAAKKPAAQPSLRS